MPNATGLADWLNVGSRGGEPGKRLSGMVDSSLKWERAVFGDEGWKPHWGPSHLSQTGPDLWSSAGQDKASCIC